MSPLNMDFSSETIMLYFFDKIIKWMRDGYIPNDEVEFQWSDLHLSVVRDYFSKFSRECDFPELPSTEYFGTLLCSDYSCSTIFAEIAASFTHDLHQWFMVPRLKKFHESEKCIKKYHLVEAFITFLLQLLCHRTDSITGRCKYRIDNLEKELRFVLTILGDTSLMLCADEHEEFQKPQAEFEAVANEAGLLVHSLFFSTDGAFEKTSERIHVVLTHINLLKANIIKFLNLLPSIRRPAYITPKTSVVDSLLIVNSLIRDLEDLMNQEDNRIADVKDQIKILHQGLILCQFSIKDIGSPKPSEIGELKEPLMRMGDVAHDAEYLIISFLGGDAPLWYLITRLTDVNSKIELIGTEFQEIAKNYKFGDLKAAKYLSTQPSLQTKSKTEADDVTVALEDKETYLLDQLVGGGTEHLQVISIYGMPGLGKTTLAKKLYNHPLVNYHFDALSWCVISQTNQRKSILTDIFIHLTCELGKDRTLEMDEESFVERIYKTLKGRRYLIVMDDIWDSNVWDNLRRCFPDDGNGSRVLFTTRNKGVAPPDSIIYALPSLSNDQCWELLKKKVFGNEPFPPELFRIGIKIAANCNGLPLAVVVIAGILSIMNKEKSKWEEVEGNLASYILEGGDNSSVMQILELSYKRLPDYLKPCFLYLGAFEDEEIHVRKLMRLWIAEGFIYKEEGKSAENIAQEYLVELIDKSLVMVAERRYDGGAKTCVIHDLLRDLCLKILEEETFLKCVKSVHRIQALEDPLYLHNCQQVRSFHGGFLESDLYVHMMKSLRVLYFDYIYDDGHYIGIEYLVNLRYLVIKDVPPSIGSLVNLEYLCVETNEIVYLPSAVRKMKKLRYIRGNQVAYGRDCNNNPQTNNLEFFSNVRILEVEDEEMLKCSPHLRKLKCSYQRLPNLHFLTQLDSLSITFDHIGLRKLEAIGFPSNIRKLTLTAADFVGEGISIIGRLENLEVLKLRYCAFEGERWDIRDGEFQKLMFLELDNIENLTEWNVASSEHFPRLQQLVLTDCHKLQEIPSEIGEISTLQLIEIKERCTKSLVVSAKRIQHEQLEMGNEELRVISADSWYIYESSPEEEDAETFSKESSPGDDDDSEGKEVDHDDNKGDDDDGADSEDEEGSTSASAIEMWHIFVDIPIYSQL